MVITSQIQFLGMEWAGRPEQDSVLITGPAALNPSEPNLQLSGFPATAHPGHQLNSPPHHHGNQSSYCSSLA